jgi:endonuclease/exonuclease/phosphatase family metal-dependent hydrolase
MMKIVIFSLVSFGLWAGDVPYIVTDLLPTPTGMEKASLAFESDADKALVEFLELSSLKRYNEAYEKWYQISSAFFDLQMLYYQTAAISSDLILKGYASKYLLSLHQGFRKKIQDKKIIDQFGLNGMDSSLLTPQQRDVTEKILTKVINSNQGALKKLEGSERYNFVVENLPVKAKRVNNRLRVLTANVLCFSEPFTYFFGGVSPWKDRIEKIVQKIKGTNADIICLQEVWGHEVALLLKEKLRKEFSCFIYDIGIQYGTLNPDEIGLNSGLFIASKIPLEEPSFTPFNKMSPAKGGVQRGALTAEFNAGGAKWKLVATHLQHGTDSTSQEIRKDQFETCSNLLGSSRGFIIGDLNINAFTPEFKSSLLFEQFFIPYLQGKRAVTRKTATATDYFNDIAHTPPSERAIIKPTYELLDYCVVRKNSVATKLIAQEKIPLFSIKDAGGALSDHHGLLTIWQVR